MNSSSGQKIAVANQFVSYQGTGINAGIRQDFVRLAGCGVKCPLRANCDEPAALRQSGNFFTIGEIIARMETEWLHVTGGEPAEHEALPDLCNATAEAGKRVQVQTSGTVAIDWDFVPFVTVSPKGNAIKDVQPSEIVLVAAQWMNAERALNVTDGFHGPVFVVPEAASGDFNARAIFPLLDALQANGRDARAGLQCHLIWGCA